MKKILILGGGFAGVDAAIHLKKLNYDVTLVSNRDYFYGRIESSAGHLQITHPKKVTTFVVDRNINYTNICWVDCKFCAFYTHEKKENAYILSFDEIDQKIDELIAIGGTQILFQGGVHPKLEIEWYEDLVEHIHNKYPQVTIHGFSAIEIDYIAQRSKLSISEVLARLKAKGLSSIPGAGAEILSDRVRDIIAPKKLDKDTWLEVHREAHKLGIKSTATMMYGTVETTREIVEHFDLVRQLQDETGGFRAFIMWSYQSDNTQLKRELPTITKTSCILTDPVNNTNNPKHIPGGTVRYMVELNNTSIALDFNATQTGSLVSSGSPAITKECADTNAKGEN